jgi:hypothetical protein
MKNDKAKIIRRETEKLDLKFLGDIPFDQQVESSIGDKTMLLKTAVGQRIHQISETNILNKK